MRFHVRLQRNGLDEFLVAHRTLMRPFAGVRHRVMFQRFRLAKGSITIGTIVRLQTLMNNFDVSSHISC